MSDSGVMDRRALTLRSWLCRSVDFMQEEKDLKRSMPEERRRRILASKRLVFMPWFINDGGYEDSQLADDLAMGFSPAGSAPCQLSPASLSVDELEGQSARSSLAIKYVTQPSGDELADVQLREKTMSEVEQGRLCGPFPWDSLPPGSSVSNSTVSIFEKPTMHGLDVVSLNPFVF